MKRINLPLNVDEEIGNPLWCALPRRYNLFMTRSLLVMLLNTSVPPSYRMEIKVAYCTYLHYDTFQNSLVTCHL